MNRERIVTGFFVAKTDDYQQGDLVKEAVLGIYVNKTSLPKSLLADGNVVVEVSAQHQKTHSWKKREPKTFGLSVKSGATVVSVRPVR
jgi:hypothetical protein